MPMLQRFLFDAPLPPAPAACGARRPTPLERCPTEILEQTLGYLDALSLHFAARTCRTLYLGAQRPQAQQCALHGLRLEPAAPSWHARHSGLARMQARWMLGLGGPHSTSPLPLQRDATLPQLPISFAGHSVVVCNSAGACLIAACGDWGRRLPDAAFVDLVDAAGRADGTLVTQSKTHLRLHAVHPQPAQLLAEAPLLQHGSRIAQHPQAPFLAVFEPTQMDLFAIEGLVHRHRIATACDAVGINAAGSCVFSYSRLGHLRAFAPKTGKMLWQHDVAQDAEMTVLDDVVVLHTAPRTTVYTDQHGSVHAAFAPPHPRTRYHRTPSPNHLWVSYVDAPNAGQITSCLLQMKTGEPLGPVRMHDGEALAVSADGAWLAARQRTQITFTRMRPTHTLLRHYR